MEALSQYVVPVSSLRMGHNELEFSVDWRFFTHFEASPVQQGKFDIGVGFDKYPDAWHLTFNVRGAVDTDCDRCLAPITLPVSGDYQLYVKFDNEQPGEEQDVEVIYLSRETTQMHLAQYLYEFIVLSIPVSRRYACEEEATPPCDQEMLKRLAGQQNEESGSDSPWDELKNIQIGN